MFSSWADKKMTVLSLRFKFKHGLFSKKSLSLFLMSLCFDHLVHSLLELKKRLFFQKVKTITRLHFSKTVLQKGLRFWSQSFSFSNGSKGIKTNYWLWSQKHSVLPPQWQDSQRISTLDQGNQTHASVFVKAFRSNSNNSRARRSKILQTTLLPRWYVSFRRRFQSLRTLYFSRM